MGLLVTYNRVLHLMRPCGQSLPCMQAAPPALPMLPPTAPVTTCATVPSPKPLASKHAAWEAPSRAACSPHNCCSASSGAFATASLTPFSPPTSHLPPQTLSTSAACSSPRWASPPAAAPCCWTCRRTTAWGAVATTTRTSGWCSGGDATWECHVRMPRGDATWGDAGTRCRIRWCKSGHGLPPSSLSPTARSSAACDGVC